MYSNPGNKFIGLSLILISLLLFLTQPATSQHETKPLSDSIELIELSNGLNIYVLERHFSPTFAAYYQFNVGSAVDPKGVSGIAHLLEHMMFKGNRGIGTVNRKKEKKIMTKLRNLWLEIEDEKMLRDNSFKDANEEKISALEKEIADLTAEHKKIIVKNEYNELMTRAGATSINASTGNDVTNYFCQLPANQLEFWFKMESERLLHPVFREFYSERDVVREERRQRTDNSARGMMGEAMEASVFHGHPYGTPVIGWPYDIERYDRADAENYFRKFYSPTNCTMVLVGDVDIDEVKKLAKKYLRSWKQQDIPPCHITAEMEQKGERRQVVEFDAEPSMQMAWPTVCEGNADEYALELLSRILGGMSSSRLDQDVVNSRGMASRIYSYNGSQRYGGTFTVGCTPRKEYTTAQLEEIIWETIEMIKAEGVLQDEIDRALVGNEVNRVRRLDSNLWLAFTIGRTVGLAGYPGYLEVYDERLEEVTSDDIQRVASKYLKRSKYNFVEVIRPQETDGTKARFSKKGGAFHSRGGEPGKRGAVHSKGFRKLLAMMESADPVQITIPVVGEDVERTVLPCGITVYIKEVHSVPAISMNITFLGGTNTTPVEDLAPYELATQLIHEGGTSKYDPIELQQKLDELGMNFYLYSGGTQSGGRFWSLTRNFDESFDLAIDILQHPRLDKERLDIIKGQYIEGKRRRYDSPGRASRVVERKVRFGDHPRLGRVITKDAIEEITPDQIREAMAKYLGTDNMYITVVGDFDKTEMLDTLERKFGDWQVSRNSTRKWLTRKPVVKPGVYCVEKDIPQPSIRIFQEMAVDRTALPEEHAALTIMNAILGGSGFRSRLMERMRSDEGLTYGIYSRLNHSSREGMPGALSISYQTKQQSVMYSIDIVFEEIRKIINEKVSEAELREQIQAWRNRFIFRFENEAYSVSRLMTQELDDRSYNYDSEMLELIQKVTLEDVQMVAQKYLDPDKATIIVFGKLTEEDETGLGTKYGFTKLVKDEVFSGGY